MGGGTRYTPDFNQIFGERNLVIVLICFELVHCQPCLYYLSHKKLQGRVKSMTDSDSLGA